MSRDPSRGTLSESLKPALAIGAVAGVLSTSAVAEETPLLQTLTAEQFLQLTEDFQALYVGGLIEGMAFRISKRSRNSGRL
jgi:hypothetical protein